jgi:hypothetical protein
LKGEVGLPLNQSVTFKTLLQKQNRVQIPKLIRLKYKLESSEILKVTVKIYVGYFKSESFFAKMYESGRIRVPDLAIDLLKSDKPNLVGYTLEVTIQPA